MREGGRRKEGVRDRKEGEGSEGRRKEGKGSRE